MSALHWVVPAIGIAAFVAACRVGLTLSRAASRLELAALQFRKERLQLSLDRSTATVKNDVDVTAARVALQELAADLRQLSIEAIAEGLGIASERLRRDLDSVSYAAAPAPSDPDAPPGA